MISTDISILLASDHAGFELKNELVEFVRSLGYAVTDMGPRQYDPTDNYPELIVPLAERISDEPDNYIGIVLGGSGQGEAIVCNRFPDVRAAVYYGGPTEIVELSRKHNDANVLSLGARFVNSDEAKNVVKLWLSTEFEGGRHAERVRSIDAV